VNYKLRDWLFSRQRYWGEPFPVLHGEDGELVTLSPSGLPLIPPDLEDFKPTGTPDGPLSKATDWVNVVIGGKSYKRETNTMPQWAGSCWYFLRYIDPHNAAEFADPAKLKYWLPVDLYVGGAEHAVLHLLYARFWHKVLFDRGYLPCPEPFQRLVNQGMILGEYEYHTSVDAHAAHKDAWLEELGITAIRRESEDPKRPDTFVLKVKALEGDKLVNLPDEMVEKMKGKSFLKGTGVELATRAEKMSKSRGNVVNPDDIVKEYGADSLRLYEMFMGPLEAVKPWDTKSIKGVYGFLTRSWRLIVDDGEEFKLAPAVQDATPNRDTLRVLHQTIQKVTKDTDGLSFNTAIAELMKFVNHMTGLAVRPRSVLEPFVLLLAPYAPHTAEELWAVLGHGPTLAYEPWPQFDPELAKPDEIEVPVQVNGKLKARLKVPAEIDDAALEAAALADETVKAAIAGKTVKMVKVVPRKLVNVVLAN
jgi:leucyl-tRNA synthetase